MTSRKPDLADAAVVLARVIPILEVDIASIIASTTGIDDPKTIDAIHYAEDQEDARERQSIVDDARAILAALDGDRFATCPAVPAALRAGLIRYVDERIRPGAFLCAAIANDLSEAVCRFNASGENTLAELKAVVNWLYNEAPGPCWGSPEKMAAWLEALETA